MGDGRGTMMKGRRGLDLEWRDWAGADFFLGRTIKRAAYEWHLQRGSLQQSTGALSDPEGATRGFSLGDERC